VFIAGRVFSFWFIVITMVAMAAALYRSTKLGKPPQLRRLAQVEAINEAVGRATEMGRPIHFSPGFAPLINLDSAQTFAGLALLGYTARLAARFNAPLIVTINQPDVFPLAEEIVNQAYVQEGNREGLKPDTVRYLSDQQFSYSAAVFGLMMREKPAANLLLGRWDAASLMIAECGAAVDAIQIAGTANPSQIPFFVAACDYTLIGEELFTAAAYVSEDPGQLGSILGQDIAKAVALGLLVLGVILKAAGIPAIERLLTL
jgi:hypothetical protein